MRISDWSSDVCSSDLAAGRRLTMSYPGGTLTINYDYDTVGNVTKIRENGATSGVGVLATYAFDTVGRPSSVTYGNGSVQSFAYGRSEERRGGKDGFSTYRTRWRP